MMKNRWLAPGSRALANEASRQEIAADFDRSEPEARADTRALAHARAVARGRALTQWASP